MLAATAASAPLLLLPLGVGLAAVAWAVLAQLPAERRFCVSPAWLPLALLLLCRLRHAGSVGGLVPAGGAMTALDLIRAGSPEPCRPWPRFSLLPAGWAALAAGLAEDPAPVLLGLWADTQQVHALFRDRDGALIASVAVEGGRYPTLSTARPVASRFERMIRDLWGHAADRRRDERTWLDHGRWPLAHPLSPRPGLPGGAVEPPEFAVAEEQGVMQVPIGPIHGLIEEPAHLRLVTRGRTVLRAEARLGYAHKGILALMRGKSPRTAARFVARLAAESTVAHSVAFARATEAALDIAGPAACCHRARRDAVAGTGGGPPGRSGADGGCGRPGAVARGAGPATGVSASRRGAARSAIG